MKKKPHTINIRDGSTMDPKEFREGLASGKYQPIREDEKVDVSKHKRFVTVPKKLLEPPMIDFNNKMIVSEIPPGAHHRVLDYISANPHPTTVPIMHRSHHFKLGFEASQYLLDLSVDQLARDMFEFAPHPFEEYTVSLWAGTEDGVAEVFVMVHPAKDGTPLASIMWMEWGQDGPPIYHSNQSHERAAGLDTDSPSDVILAWLLCDAFRLLLTRQTVHTIVKGGRPRAAVRKGKRVHFYSASEIKIDLDAAAREKVIVGNGFGKMMPVYQYRAHLCHHGGQRGCEHFWIEIGGMLDESGVWHPDNQHPRENATWECYHCGRRRWHRKAGVRGSAEVGYVRQTYSIVKGEDDAGRDS